MFPDALDISAAGHYLAGEGISDGVREILEELGVSVPFDELIPLGIKIDLAKQPGIVNHEFCHTFMWRSAKPIPEYNLGEDEVEGLVQISISDGLDLFSGRRDKAFASGVELEKGSRSWTPIEMEVTVSDFIPRVDSYYYKIFIMAERLLNGAQDLAI
ncbi:hypothetical protein CTI14_19340 [Methylobacterium radiotolerans]|nr:hypothetical protein CTI14_19340 [Methylobacterium radiotolerans]